MRHVPPSGPLLAHLAAAAAWRLGLGSEVELAETLTTLTRSVTRRTRQLAARLPWSGVSVNLPVVTVPSGDRVGSPGGPELADIAQDLVIATLERYRDDPGFRVESEGWIEVGLALRAYTAVRRGRRRLAGEHAFELARPCAQESEREAGFADGPPSWIEAAWFHQPGETASFEGAPALSVRYLYASIRTGSGASQTTIADELGVHRAQLTRLKAELSGFVPGVKAFLPLGDYLPIGFSEPARLALDLHGRSSKTAMVCKRALWALWRCAAGEGTVLVLGPDRRIEAELLVRAEHRAVVLHEIRWATAT